MRILLISIHYPPIISSCAEQMRDLALELKRQGHEVVILTPNPQVKKNFCEKTYDGIRIITIKGFKIKNNYSFLYRGILDILLPFKIIYQLFVNKRSLKNIDGIVWYSPSSFFAPLIFFLKKISKAKTYLILRDQYPEDLINIGLIKSKFIILIFKIFNKCCAVILVQNPLKSHFRTWHNLRWCFQEMI